MSETDKTWTKRVQQLGARTVGLNFDYPRNRLKTQDVNSLCETTPQLKFQRLAMPRARNIALYFSKNPLYFHAIPLYLHAISRDRVILGTRFHAIAGKIT